MRRISLLLAVIGALAVPPSASASCSASVRWNGGAYLGTSVASPLPLGGALGGGVVPACDDVIVVGPDGRRQNPKPADTPVALRAIAGVPTALAVARPEEPRVAYLAPGTLPQLRSHPLHRRFHGRRKAARHRDCSRPQTVRLTVFGTPFGTGPLLVKTSAGLSTWVVLEPGTRVRAARKLAGQPVLRQGDRLVVTGPRCGTGADTALVAKRIRVAR